MVPTMNRLAVAILLLSLCSCKASKQKQSEADAQPELLNLQSKCTAMGKKVMQGNLIGNALTQEQVSRYNPKDNRCYVKLTVHTADLTTPREKYEKSDYLVDGQTGVMLAYATQEGQKNTGMVLDTSLEKLMQEKKQSIYDYDATDDLINSFVMTQRRP